MVDLEVWMHGLCVYMYLYGDDSLDCWGSTLRWRGYITHHFVYSLGMR